ncbi:MAG: hypothetical protein FJZ87_04085 [Chloroflexi bacterium]|nr:hypothetical protein [Chloroflexota bacterium]
MIENLFELPEESRLVDERGIGRPRLENANRQQIAMRYAALDDLLVEDHRARMVWEMVQGDELSSFYDRVATIEGAAGRPAIDPRLLIAVWLYATLEGVVSARGVQKVRAVLLWYALAHNLFQVLSMRLELQTAAILQGPKEFGTYQRRCLRLLFSTIF